MRNSIKPTLRIVKVDSVTKGPIEGVTFEVRVTDGGKIGDYVTDENGEIFVTGLQAGVNYTIREIATLPGYVLDETPKQITLEANKVTTVQFENKAKSPVYILKLDAKTGKGVPGVRFRVTRADGSLIGEVVTDSTGRATLTNVPSGYITVTEIAVPDGYVLRRPSWWMAKIPWNLSLKMNRMVPFLSRNGTHPHKIRCQEPSLR